MQEPVLPCSHIFTRAKENRRKNNSKCCELQVFRERKTLIFVVYYYRKAVEEHGTSVKRKLVKLRFLSCDGKPRLSYSGPWLFSLIIIWSTDRTICILISRIAYISEIREIVSFRSFRLIMRVGKTFTGFIITRSLHAVLCGWSETLTFF